MTLTARRQRIIAALFLLVAGGSGCGADDESPIEPSGSSVTVAASETAFTIAHGNSQSVDILVARSGSYAGPVTMSAEQLPRGVTATFTPAVLPHGSTRAVLRLSVQATAIPGTNNIVVRGSAAGVGSMGLAMAVMVPAAPGR